jgi:hypothetical protein
MLSDSLESLKSRMATEANFNSAETWFDISRAVACGKSTFPEEAISEVAVEAILEFSRKLNTPAGRELSALELIRAQDLRCLLELSLSGRGPSLSESVIEELGSTAILAGEAVLPDDEKDALADYFSEFSIPAEWRLPSLEYPWGAFEEQIAGLTYSPMPEASRSWSSATEELAGMPMMLSDDTPGENLQDWFERIDEIVELPGGLELKISVRLAEDWRAVVDVSGDDGGPPELRRLSLGGIGADPVASDPCRWVIDLSIVPPSIRQRILEGPLLIETLEGELLRVSG